MNVYARLKNCLYNLLNQLLKGPLLGITIEEIEIFLQIPSVFTDLCSIASPWRNTIVERSQKIDCQSKFSKRFR
jgi:hypothetical protein